MAGTKRACRIPTKLDKKLESKFLGYTNKGIAYARGLYLDFAEKNGITEFPLETDIDTWYKLLKDFIFSEENLRIKKQIDLYLSHPLIAREQLKESFEDPDTRKTRIDYIVNLFLDEVDNMQAKEFKNSGVSRQRIITGFKDTDGNQHGGAKEIYRRVNNTIVKRMQKLQEELNGLDNSNTEKKERIREQIVKHLDIIRNLTALSVEANLQIKHLEGVKIDATLSYAGEISPLEDSDNSSDSANIINFTVEESTKERYQELEESKSPFGTTSAMVKRALYLPIESEKDDLGNSKRTDPRVIHGELMRLFLGIESEADMMLALHKWNSYYGKAISEQLHQKLVKDPELRTRFFVDFSKIFQTYSMTTDKNGKTQVPVLNRITKNKASKSIKTKIISGNMDFGGTIYKTKKAGNTTSIVFNIENLKELKETLNQETLSVVDYSDIFTLLGIEQPQIVAHTVWQDAKLKQSVDSAITNLKIWLNASKIQNEIKKEQTVKNIFNIKIGNEGTSLNEILGTLNSIGQNITSYIKVESRVRYQGNSYYSHVASSYLGRIINRFQKINADRPLKGDISKITHNFISKKWGNSGIFVYQDNVGNKHFFNPWLEHLYRHTSVKDQKDSFLNNISYDRFLGSENKSMEDFSSNEHIITLLHKFFNGSTRSRTKNAAYIGMAHYQVFIQGDSDAVRFIEAPIYTEEQIIEHMYQLYRADVEVQKYVKKLKEILPEDQLDSLKHIDTTKFGILPFLNETKINEDNTEEEVKNLIREHLNSSFAKFYDRISKIKSLPQKFNDERLREFFVNHKLATMAQIQLASVSPIFYKGGSVVDMQKRYKGKGTSGSRLSPDALDVYADPENPQPIKNTQNVVYIKDVEISPKDIHPEFIKVLESVFGESSEVVEMYKSSSYTDGQGWRTFSSYREILIKAGKWSHDLEYAYNRIQEIRNEIRNSESKVATDKQAKEIADLYVSFQPIKPLLETIENVNIGNGAILPVPVQLKYAEVSLIPELLPKGPLRSMLEWAEENDVDLIAATSAVKVGCFGSVSTKEALDDSAIRETMAKAKIHELSTEDYIIQTNVPDHTHEARLFATQMRKLILAFLPETDENGQTIYYDNYTGLGVDKVRLGTADVKLNATNLMRFYNALIGANIVDSVEKFINSSDNTEELRNSFIQMLLNIERDPTDSIEGLSPRRSKENFEFIEDEFLVPLFEGGIENSMASMWLSKFKKEVNKQIIMGGSAVQVSAYGLTYKEESEGLQFIKDPNNPNNILYAECEIPWDLFYEKANGEKKDIPYDKYVNGDGTLKTNDKGEVLLDIDYPGIRDIVAYRIPTEELYSVMNLKVVRFTLKANGGGTIKVPLEGTTIAGFDFDIDKLYFMRKQFKLNKSTQSWNKRVWEALYKHHNILEQLEAARREYEIKGSKIVDAILGEFKGTENLKGEDGRIKLHYFWEMAKLNETLGDKQEVFDRFVKEQGEEIEKAVGWESYDPSKSPWDKTQSRVGRNNVLLNMIKGRLMDPNSMNQRFTPGGFNNAIAAANEIKQLMGIQEDNRDYTDPFTLVDIYQQNIVAGKLIGIFANQNANHAMVSNLEGFALKNNAAIAFGDHTLNGGLTNLLNPEALTKELLAASVDAVKQPVLNFLNFNTITADSAGLLCRLGYSFREIGLLFNQPIIKEICEYMADNNITDFESGVRLYTQNVRDLNSTGRFSSSVVDTKVSTNELITELKNYTSNKDNFWNNSNNIFNQYRVLQLFSDIYSKAKEVGKFVTSTKFTASNAVKSTFGGMLSQQLALEDFLSQINAESSSLNIRFKTMTADPTQSVFFTDASLQDIIKNEDSESMEEYMRRVMNSPFGYEQVMYDANVAAVKAAEKYFPYGKSVYKNVISFINSLFNSTLKEDSINAILAEMLNYQFYILNGGNNSFNPESKIIYIGEEGKKEEYTTKEYYTKIVPNKILDRLATNPELKDKYFILSALSFTEEVIREADADNKTPITQTIMKFEEVGALSLNDKNKIMESWGKMIDDGEIELAHELFFYSYHHNGFGFGNIGFNHLAPTKLKTSLIAVKSNIEGEPNITYVDTLYSMLNTSINDPSSSSDSFSDFLKYLFIHNIKNSQLVYNVFEQDAKNLSKYIQTGIGSTGLSASITFHPNNKFSAKFAQAKVSKKDKTLIKWRPAFKANINNVGPCLFIAEIPSSKIIEDGKMLSDLFTIRGEITYKMIPLNDITKLEEVAPNDPNPERVGQENESSINEIDEILMRQLNEIIDLAEKEASIIGEEGTIFDSSSMRKHMIDMIKNAFNEGYSYSNIMNMLMELETAIEERIKNQEVKEHLNNNNAENVCN